MSGNGIFSINDLGEENEFDVFFSLNQKFYMIDNLSVGIYEGYSYTSESHSFNFGGSIGYTFLKSPENSTGIAHTLEISSGAYIFDSNRFITLTPSYTFEYFITERIAPYLKIGPNFWVESDSDSRTDLDLRIGLALHFPTKMRVNIPVN